MSEEERFPGEVNTRRYVSGFQAGREGARAKVQIATPAKVSTHDP